MEILSLNQLTNSAEPSTVSNQTEIKQNQPNKKRGRPSKNENTQPDNEISADKKAKLAKKLLDVSLKNPDILNKSIENVKVIENKISKMSISEIQARLSLHEQCEKKHSGFLARATIAGINKLVSKITRIDPRLLDMTTNDCDELHVAISEILNEYVEFEFPPKYQAIMLYGNCVLSAFLMSGVRLPSPPEVVPQTADLPDPTMEEVLKNLVANTDKEAQQPSCNV
jgi:hypothetical protein